VRRSFLSKVRQDYFGDGGPKIDCFKDRPPKFLPSGKNQRALLTETSFFSKIEEMDVSSVIQTADFGGFALIPLEARKHLQKKHKESLVCPVRPGAGAFFVHIKMWRTT